MIEFFDTLKANFEFIKGVVLNKINLEQSLFNMCFYGNRANEIARTYSLYFYNNFPVVKTGVDYFYYGANVLFAYSQMRRVEPMTKSWSCVSALIKSYYTYKEFTYKYNELYEYEPVIGFEKMAAFCNNLYYTVAAIIKSETALAESLITYKYDNKIIHRICNAKKLEHEPEMRKIVTDLSDIKFLCIEYHSKDYMHPLVIELDKNEYLINNEILSSTFVKRALEYKTVYHKFDKNYTLFIMDNNLRTVSLNFGEYIVLHKTYYTIMSENGIRETISKDRNEESEDDSTISSEPQ